MGVMEFLFAPKKMSRVVNPSGEQRLFFILRWSSQVGIRGPFTGQCNRIFMRFNVNFNTTTFLRLVVNITSQQWV